MNKLGEYILSLRNHKKYSQKHVQNETGVTDSQQSRIERGDICNVSPFVLKKLADFYNVNVIELFILAGFINDDDIKQHTRIFKYSELLSDEQKHHIQEEITMFTKNNSILEEK